jgi:hypothetical protein
MIIRVLFHTRPINRASLCGHSSEPALHHLRLHQDEGDGKHGGSGGHRIADSNALPTTGGFSSDDTLDVGGVWLWSVIRIRHPLGLAALVTELTHTRHRVQVEHRALRECVNNGRVNNGRVNNGRVNNGRVNNGRVNNGRVNTGRAGPNTPSVHLVAAITFGLAASKGSWCVCMHACVCLYVCAIKRDLLRFGRDFPAWRTCHQRRTHRGRHPRHPPRHSHLDKGKAQRVYTELRKKRRR